MLELSGGNATETAAKLELQLEVKIDCVENDSLHELVRFGVGKITKSQTTILSMNNAYIQNHNSLSIYSIM